MFLLALLLGCPSPTHSDEPTLPSHPQIPLGGCGLPESDWLAFDEVGVPVDWEPVEELSISADTLGLALALAGLPEGIFDLQHDVTTYRVRYTTQDHGAPVEATMLISMPDGAGEVPTLAWLHPTVGFNDACAPSRGGLEEAAFNLIFASTGKFVVAPDYLGLNGFGAPSERLHPYVVGEPTAVVSLDGLRAAWAVQEQIDAFSSHGTHRTVLMGASEGGFAALWTDRYQPHYLFEAEIVGVVAAVPPADVAGLHKAGLTEPLDATRGLAGALTTWHDWYQMETPLEAFIDPELAAVLPDAMRTECNIGSIAGDRSAPADFFTPAFIASVLDDDSTAFPDHACAMAQNTLLTSDIPYAGTAPVLYVVGENDELVVASPTRDAFLPLCEAGYSMQYLECAGADHVEGAAWSLLQQFEWAEARLAGQPLGDTCLLQGATHCTLEGAF